MQSAEEGSRPADLPPARERAGWSTSRWLGTGTTVALVVLLVLGSCGTWALMRSTAVNQRLADRWSPALISSVRLEAALVNQETGIRGYGLAGDTQFLTPYRDGLAQQGKAMEQLAGLTATDPRASADLARVSELTDKWHTSVARPIAAAADPTALARERAEDGRAQFDTLRAALGVQQDHISAERDRARTDLASVREMRNTVFVVIAAVVLALMALAFAGLRLGVQRPLDRLRADVRQVASGDYTHMLVPTGPADIQVLASDVDAMRRRLAEDLDLKDRARAVLDAQTVELRRSNEELEQFAYVASHDLQEPLRKVASFCQLLERRYAEQLDDRAKQYISFAVDGANRMQHLINDLLTFSRVGRLHTDDQPVELGSLVRRTVGDLDVAVQQTGATVTYEDLPTVHGQPTQLGLVLQNLIANALKFRAPGIAPAVHVAARRVPNPARGGSEEAQRPFWEISVTDNGIGIAPEYAERVFVIFQRLHTRESYEGNGIGLALCKKIVEHHGGAIAVDTTVASGTRFTFTLPGEAEPPEEAETPEAAETDEGAEIPAS
ncbi:ATP-binding protein [Streptomyces sp. AM 2-1-1]|uniref:sensor histidine kinase n=1 Tax=Streptomyces sp. AM 2-1-1 TaxID=3028709 RepID=UPI0023B97CB9|nr:ATP-binding protein [Streptomyces sp. AM 2-1-1]WEH41761.1 CHASE3 domain-containing protein [Streptomyces sp. AM 2-1-1]